MMSGVASFVPEMPVPCVDECSRSGVRGVCDATSELGDSLPETCEVPGAWPADVTSDLLGSGPSAVGGRGILVSERVQKHVNPSSGDVCAPLPVSVEFQDGVKGLDDNLSMDQSNISSGSFGEDQFCLSRAVLA